jgi:hypothetical protein
VYGTPPHPDQQTSIDALRERPWSGADGRETFLQDGINHVQPVDEGLDIGFFGIVV